ncbi:hypothetical protein Vadar_021216 [Vaccinium darrowii]|uniref:Uncharacterized protein n=1 Tax=Vaccinium darrowii TaxID=229202 RepID=A0ACB7YG96_9ERIC|nr:hypothetical protein Vadar_021216 [Vaccinium darrowii]
MASEQFVQPAIPRFDGHHDHWSMLMENFMRSKEYWHLIEVGYTEPAESSTLTDAQKLKLEELKLKDLKAKNYLFQAIDRTILETILTKDTSKQIWDAMKQKYRGNAKNITVSFDDEEEESHPQVPASEHSSASSQPAVLSEEDDSQISATSRPEHIRRRSAWMQDYVVRGVDQSDDPLIHFALFANCDPVTFQDAVKDPK